MKFKWLEAETARKPEPGEVLIDSGLAQDALPFLLAAKDQDPHNARHWNNLGKAYKLLGEFRRSIDCFWKAIKFDPESPVPTANLGMAREELGEFDAAQRLYEQALQQAEQLGQERLARAGIATTKIAYALACSYLRRGEYTKAWPLWELPRGGAPTIPGIEVWRGELPVGKRFLVMHEGGYGDALWLLRYCHELQVRGAHVTYYGPAALKGLLGQHPWIDRWGDERDEMETSEFDYQVQLWSIMAALNLCPLETEGPYIKASPYDYGLDIPKVGICWRPAEAPNHWRKQRGIQEELLESFPMGPSYVSLQYGLPCPGWMVNVNIEMREGWQATARIVAGLDLVISADTAMLHLAGAMGKETWAVLPLQTDWKWGKPHRHIWYPTITKFFDNTDPLSFEPAVRELRKALEERFGEPAGSGRNTGQDSRVAGTCNA